MKYLHTLLGSLLLALVSTSAQAQVQQEQLNVPSGSIFEIIAHTDASRAQFSWVLTDAEQNFVEAGPDQVFRTRFLKAGVYTLSADIREGASGKRTKKTITIDVFERTQNLVSLTNASGSLLSETLPVRDQYDRIVLPQTTDIVALFPDDSNTQTLSLDLDDTNDTDNDGDKKNDNDLKNSYFSTRNSPLYIWFTKPVTKKTLYLGYENSRQVLEEVGVYSPSEAARDDAIRQKEERENPEVLMDALTNNRIRFSLDTSNTGYGEAPLLYHWDFGDGTQSLLDQPLHTYGSSGNYNVSVRVRNLRTGEVVGRFVSIAKPSSPTVSSSSSSEDTQESSSSSSSEETTAPTEDSGILGLILKVAAVLLVSILIGVGIMVILSIIRKRGGIQKMIDDAEDSLPPTGTPDPDSTPSLELPDTPEEPEPETEQPTPESTEPEPAPTPSWLAPSEGSSEENKATVDVNVNVTTGQEQKPEATPSWLQDGLQQAQAEGQTQDSPPPAELTGTQDTTPEPTTEPTPEPVQDEPLPAWLQPDAGAQPAPNVAPEPTPAEQTPPPAPEPEVPAQEPEQQKTSIAEENKDETVAQPADAPLPAWLQPDAGAQPAPDVAPEPTPEPTAVEQNDTSTPEPEAPVDTTNQTPQDPAPTDAPVPAWLQTPEEQTKEEPAPAETQEAETEDTLQIKQDEKDAEVDTTEQKDWDSMTPEEKQRERKRQKRRRYRENKKKRAQEGGTPAEETPTPAETVQEPKEVTPATEASVPAWLQAPEQKTTEATTPEAKEIPKAESAPEPEESEPTNQPSTETAEEKQSDESDIQFLIRADSIEEQDTGSDEKKSEE